jgi:hypothetical protein
MKYRLTILTVLTMLLCVALYANEGTPGLLFEYIGSAYGVSRGTATDSHIEIPDSHNGLPVTQIVEPGFQNFTTMTSIIIPHSITVIADEAFRNCTGLFRIFIPINVTWIGMGAFRGCSNLTIYVEASTRPAGWNAWIFNPWDGYRPVYWSTTISEIDNLAFSLFTNPDRYTVSKGLSTDINVIIPNHFNGIPVTMIGNSGFAGCTILNTIIIPNSITSIGHEAFFGCTSLNSIPIPNSVVSIGQRAFRNSGLWNNTPINEAVYADKWAVGFRESLVGALVLRANTFGISDMAFDNCVELTSVVIPNSVTMLGIAAFRECYNLASVTFETPSSLTTIGPLAFDNCHSLTSITIPSSVTTIGFEAFYECVDMVSVTFETPSNLSIIGEGAFGFCAALTEITIPNNVIELGDWTFVYCIELTTVTFEANSRLTTIGDRSFYGCNKLTSISIPSSIITVGDAAFYHNTSLTSVTFETPSNLTTIGDEAFSNCSNLTTVIIGPQSNLSTIGIAAFYGCTKLTSISLPRSMTEIGEIAFMNCTSLTSITFETPSNLTTIGHTAFWGCASLTSITIPNSVTTIGWGAFYNNTSLTSVTFETPSKLTLIDFSVFDGCSSLESIIIPGSVTEIGDEAFALCSSLLSVTFETPSKLTKIGESAFFDCYSIESITIPNSVISIGNDAFYGCFDIMSVTFETPSSLTTIGDSAFFGCTRVRYITIPNSVTSIGRDAFRNTGIWINTTNNNIVYADRWAVGIRGTIAGSLNLETDIVGISDRAFFGFADLTAVSIPNSLAMIGSSAFANCGGLNTIVIPNHVTTIGISAFAGCTDLTIYAKVPSRPAGWHVNWNPDNRLVVWNYEPILPAPKNLKITDTVLTWDTINSAVSYLVYVDEDTFSVSENSYSFEHLTDIGIYNVKVMAIGDDIMYFDSEWSEEIEYIIFTTLSIPTNLHIEGTTLTWNTVDNAEGYIVDINGETFEVVENNYSLSALVLIDTYTIKVKASGDNILYYGSDWSEEIEYTILSDNNFIDPVYATALMGNYPNPFNPVTTIQFSLSFGRIAPSCDSILAKCTRSVGSEGFVMIDIYNIRGQHIRTLVNGVYGAGTHSVTWNGTDDYGRNVSSGMYLYRMTTGEYTSVRRMMLLK